MKPSSFAQLDLIKPLRRAVADVGYIVPTPIQAEAIPHLLEGRDLLGCAQTGTGKTAAFALPILQRLASNKRPPAPRTARVLVLTPTRELAVQIADSFRAYGRHLELRQTVVFGGVGQAPQVYACRRGVDVLVATPGRLLDLMGQGHLRLDRIEVFVLDEADRMLDMGFLPDIKRVLACLPRQRQTLFFSATMQPKIARLADTILTDPVKVAVTPSATPVERIGQKVLFVAQGDKRALLGEVLKDARVKRALVFTRTKHGADRLTKQLARLQVRAEAIHGNKSQNARQAALEKFRSGRTRVLVATDIAARGIDVEGITHVINYDLPNEPESYVHRIGRTGRAGAEGEAISFCDAAERAYLRDIERLIRQVVPVVEDHPYRAANNAPAKAPVAVFPGNGSQRRRPRGGRRPGMSAS
ncbi:MAG: DEAD/DEAH box helicase [Proteobacteria bacterium]|nr:DEAD/DEAH box helicase [Pseudomonadota bacterium]MBU1740521.1 DEAD/DEAH box helicase [Pseudomonadota bacterium]